MIGETEPQFDKQILIASLKPGEELLEPPERAPDDLRDAYGYEIYPIRDESGAEGNSVFLVMEQQGDGVEPVKLIGEAVLTITPVAGQGIIVMHIPDEGVRSDLLEAGDGPNSALDTTELARDWSYAYLNTGDGPFVVRDDSRPDFKPEYEEPVTDQDVLAEFEAYGIQRI